LRLKILKKLRTASLNSEFTGSRKKCVIDQFKDTFCKETAKYITLIANINYVTSGLCMRLNCMYRFSDTSQEEIGRFIHG